jgi:hypothetical protein
MFPFLLLLFYTPGDLPSQSRKAGARPDLPFKHNDAGKKAIAFVKMQRVQLLKVVASGLKSQRAFVMDMARGSFTTIEELACCMRASCLLPGVAGPVMNMRYPRVGDGGGCDMRL